MHLIADPPEPYRKVRPEGPVPPLSREKKTRKKTALANAQYVIAIYLGIKGREVCLTFRYKLCRSQGIVGLEEKIFVFGYLHI